MVANPNHLPAKAEGAAKAESEDVVKSTELLYNAMLGLLGKEARKLLETPVPQHLIECFNEVKVLCDERNMVMEDEVAVIHPLDVRYEDDFLFSTVIFRPFTVDEWVNKHYPTKRAKFLGWYQGFGYVRLVNKTEGASTYVT